MSKRTKAYRKTMIYVRAQRRQLNRDLDAAMAALKDEILEPNPVYARLQKVWNDRAAFRYREMEKQFAHPT